MQFAKKHGLLESNRVFMIRTHFIRPNPGQPRRIFDAEGLSELADSIRQYGVLQPLTVRKLENGSFELVAGERRLRAARLAGLEEVPCILLGADEKQSSLIALVENLQRCDLDFFEEAEGIQRLIRQFGLSQEEAARRIGKSQSALANKLRILRHPPEIIQSIRDNGLTERHARALLRLEDEDDRKTVIETIVERRLNVAQTDEYIDAYLATAVVPRPSEPEVTGAKDKIRTLYIFKDVRLFLNTVNRAVDVVRRAGIPANLDKEEVGDEIILTIKVPKRV
ncbi:MAG: ParB/RepB/Spo0J family partition protein [Oscillospiraceae bacterium]|jgi:ParB family chromosome partitioning protein|nr:ParB/RepB/Spo0J family partition protein [Oscillospiraceae bacterium]